MRCNSIFLLLIAGLTLSAKASAQSASSDLRRLVEELQRSLKPTVGQKPALVIRDAPAYMAQGYPMPLFLNGHVATLDSLAKYSLADLYELRVDKTDKATALYGTPGSWGIIYVNTKKKKQN